MSEPEILESVADLRAFVKAQRQAGKTVAYVPTMGALHEGHMTLVREGLKRADICIVSIFVNPTQFGPDEDLDAYPRTWPEDLDKIGEAGGQAVYHPPVHEIYPDGYATMVKVEGVTAPLEGAQRPGHFEGVATVVTKLLMQVLPDFALFGEKDYQQLSMIRRMAKDLDIPAEIIGVPTVRDENGLALSSRNKYLSKEQYPVAVTLNRTLKDLADKIGNGGTNYQALEEAALKQLLDAGFQSVDYVSIRDADTLQTPSEETKTLRILAAAWLGTARLIDNMAV